MTSDDFDKMQKEFSDLAQKFLDSGYKHQFVHEALGSTLINLGPHDNVEFRILHLEATYAQIAKLLGRDASAMLPRDRFSPALKGIEDE